MGTTLWVSRRGIEPSFTYRAKVEQVAPRRARTLSIEGPIRNVHLPRRQAFGVPERTPFDHRGHLIASRFGGPNARVNLVAMHGLVNQSGGPWYGMEQEIASMLPAPREVEGSDLPVMVEWTGTMKVVVQYHEGDPFRPVAFHVEARDSRGQVKLWRIHNRNPYLSSPRDPRRLREVEEVSTGVADDVAKGSE